MRNSRAVKEQFSLSRFRSIHIFWNSIATSWPIESNGKILNVKWKEVNEVPYLIGGVVGVAIGVTLQRLVLENGMNSMNPQICKYCQWKKANEWRWEEKKNRRSK